MRLNEKKTTDDVTGPAASRAQRAPSHSRPVLPSIARFLRERSPSLRSLPRHAENRLPRARKRLFVESDWSTFERCMQSEQFLPDRLIRFLCLSLTSKDFVRLVGFPSVDLVWGPTMVLFSQLLCSIFEMGSQPPPRSWRSLCPAAP